MNIDQKKRINFGNPTEEQKELIRYWVEKYRSDVPHAFTGIGDNFIEKYLSPKPKIEAGKWYKGNGGLLSEEYLGYITEIKDGKFYYYGFNCCGDWVDKDWYSNFFDITEATEQEVTKRLIGEAKRLGITEGASIISTSGVKFSRLHGGYVFNMDTNKLYYGGAVIFDNGKWAEIIPAKKLPAPSELEDAIKALDNATEKLKNLLK